MKIENFRTSNLPLNNIEKIYKNNTMYFLKNLMLTNEPVFKIFITNISKLKKNTNFKIRKEKEYGYLLRMSSKTTIRGNMGVINPPCQHYTIIKSVKQIINSYHYKVFTGWNDSGDDLYLNDRVFKVGDHFAFDSQLVINPNVSVDFFVSCQSALGMFLKCALGGVNEKDMSLFADISKQTVFLLIKNNILISKKSPTMAQISREFKRSLYFPAFRGIQAKSIRKTVPALLPHLSIDITPESVRNLKKILVLLRMLKHVDKQRTGFKSWISFFYENYGDHNVIPIVEAYKNYLSFQQSIFLNSPTREVGTQRYWDKIKNTLIDCIQGSEVVLTDSALQKISSELNIDEGQLYRESLEVGIEPMGDDTWELVNGLFSLGAKSFVSAYQLSDFSKIKNRNNHMYTIDYTANYAPDLSVYNSSSNGQRILFNSLKKEHGDLMVSELGFFTMGENVFIIDMKNKHNVIPYNPTSLSFNHDVESGLALFLTKIANYMTDVPDNGTFFPISSGECVPSVKYKNVVLSERTWFFDVKTITNRTSARNFIDNVLIPRIKVRKFSIYEDSQKFPISLDNQYGKSLFIKDILHLEKLFVIPDDRHTWQSQKKRVNAFINLSTGKKNIPLLNQDGIFSVNRVPSCVWQTLTLITHQALLPSLLQKTLKYLKEKQVDFFFIRYVDSQGWQLRIRFHTGVLHDKFKYFIGLLMDTNMITDYRFSSFFPEKSRYGGKLSLQANDIFVAETSAFGTINSFLRSFPKWYSCALIASQIFSQIDFSSNRNLIYQSGISYITSKQIKNFYKQLNTDFSRDLNQLSILLPSDVRKLTFKYLNAIATEFPTNYFIEVMYSIVHMRINRWVGIDLHEEMLGMNYALKNFNPRKKVM